MTVLKHVILEAVSLIKIKSVAAKQCLWKNEIAQCLQSHTQSHIKLISFERLTNQT